LEPRAAYRVTGWDRPEDKCVSGLDLMNKGLSITLAAPRSAAVVEYRKQIE
jgi:hypothetical protein